MIFPDQVPIREVREEYDEGRQEIGVEVRDEEAEEEENGESPSHLPFAPSLELPDSTTVDPSYIISLVRKLLPNSISTQKQNASYSLYPVETSKVCPLEENVEGESNYTKKLAGTEANDNSVPHSIANDKCEGSINDQVVDQTYSSTFIYNGMKSDSRNEDTDSDDRETGFIDKEYAWEDSGCILWDLSASSTHAEFMVNNFMLEVLQASLHASTSSRITEICLGILGNLACHDVSSNAMASKDGLIETVVNQLYLDDSPCLSETFRLLTVALQGTGSMLWAKALLSEQTCLRIIWIVGNTLKTMLLEKEICLGILGNLACHDVSSNAMASKDGLIETVVNQLYLDDSPCLSETFRLLTVALQGTGSMLWAKALLSEQTCLRIIWIVGNTLNTMLLEKSIDFLLTVINNEVTNVLLQPLIKLGLPNLVVNLLSCEMSNLDDENKSKRTSFLDPVLCLVEALSTIDCGLEMIFPTEELCNLVCRVIKLPEKYENIASQLSQDYEFLRGLLETIPFVSDDPQSRDALWCILERLLVRISELEIDISSLHHLVSLFLENSSLIMDDLDGHCMENSSPINGPNNGAIVRSLLRISCIIDGWLARKNEKIEKTAHIVDSKSKAERLLHYCKKYSSVLSAPKVR